MSEAAAVLPPGGAMALVLTAFVLSAALAWAAIGYARRRGMLDMPGRRRSHSVPTPRGGGIGLIAGSLAGGLPALAWGAWPAAVVAVTGLACVLVAVVGAWDDHRSLPVLPRLLAQAVATVAFAGVIAGYAQWSWWWMLPLVLAGTWSINLHNFMDGIDGLLAGQLVFMGVALSLLAWALGDAALAIACMALAVAAVGFGLFNRSPARIFMGDVGSGAAGLLVFMLACLCCAADGRAAWLVLVLGSGFAVDAGLTLLLRMWRGRRWYTAHREHLYQWLVRSGWSHTRTGCIYMLWNLLAAAPVAYAAWWHPHWAPVLCVGLYLAAAMIWWQARRWCLQR